MIVADAGPLIAFARIGQLNLLRQVVGTLYIPDAVYNEMVHTKRERPGATEITRGAWIHRRAIRDEAAVTQLPSILYSGERQAIVLAQELGAALLSDEQHGRTIARQRGRTVIGSLRILASAKRHGYIERVKPLVIGRLTAGYWLDDALLGPFLRSVGEHNE
jgi:predicted nucleic acid-binding protein